MYPILIGAAGAGLAVHHYLTRVVEVPTVVHADNAPSTSQLSSRLTKLRQPFAPTFWAWGAHSQTILTTLRNRNPPGSFKRQIVTAPDGGHFALDWFFPQGGVPTEVLQDPQSIPGLQPPKKGILFILHGLTGSSHDGYCRDLALEGCKRGFQPVIMTYRGCHELKIEKSPLSYSAAYTGDAHQAVEEIVKILPGHPIVAAGFSLGSMVLCKLLAEQGDLVKASSSSSQGDKERAQTQIRAGALISSPVDMWSAMDGLEKGGFASLYNRVLADKLRGFAERHSAGLSLRDEIDLESVKSGKTIRDFEKSVILPLFGYKTLDDYYKDGSSHLHYDRIKAPALILVSRDDPFLGYLPEKEVKANPNLILAYTKRGGHVAWLKGPFAMQSWADEVVVEYLEEALNLQGSTVASFEDGAKLQGTGGLEPAGI